MATRDQQGNWTFDDNENAQIEILARARVRADEIRDDRKRQREAEEQANKCDLCGKDKRQGTHGKGKCNKRSSAWGLGAE